MAGLGEISIRVEGREGDGEEPVYLAGEEPSTSTGKDRRISQDPGGKPENRNGEPDMYPVDGQKRVSPSILEYYRTKFYGMYRREAEEYDREFIKNNDEDLNTTLIFAGLFSAVTSAFVIQVHSQLQPDSNTETAALLRVLIHKIDNTTFGGVVPPVPQPWSGPPRTIIQVQTILYASLATSLFSAFLAMLGKQWLNRYSTIDMRGSEIERSQNRQRKLDGIVTWHFDHVMESSPLMLQFALLLLGCALSRYLWDIDKDIGSVVLGVTLFGVVFYAFIVVAGTVSVSCPYQTPGAHILHYIIPLVLKALRSASSSIVNGSVCVELVAEWRNNLTRPWRSTRSITESLLVTLLLPVWLGCDAYLLARGTINLFVALARRVRGWFRGARSAQVRGSDQQTVALDLQCITWMLQTSLDKAIHLLALKLLTIMTTPTHLNPALLSACFDILASCVSIVGGKAVITQGSEELAEVSAPLCFRTLSRLAAEDPTLSGLKDVRQRYIGAFPSETSFEGLPASHTFGAIHNLFHSSQQKIRWEDYQLSTDDQVILSDRLAKFAAHSLAKLAHSRAPSVPRWILRFALHHLSQDPLPPPSIVANCLSIIAIDLGCTVSDTTKSALPEDIANLITDKLGNMAQVETKEQISSKRKAATAFFPYAVWQERDGNHTMIDAFLGVAKASKSGDFVWRKVQPFLVTLFDETRPDETRPGSFNRVIVLMSPYLHWSSCGANKNMVIRWAEAASAVPYTEEICQSVVDALLQIASIHYLRQHIPVDAWTWLKRRPSLPSVCRGRSRGITVDVVHAVRALQDVETLKSYLLLVWSEGDYIHPKDLTEMINSVREDFTGLGILHREDLLKHLNHLLADHRVGQNALPRWHPLTRRAETQYARLRDMLREVIEAESPIEILTRTFSRLINLLDFAYPSGHD